ncbi:MAG TPA: prepilin-type N-terminal cleavage/methylation domain-containing protein [Kiritimatiellia bacterium]|nr:prepilin-type N-terminal cleavage/methylation domain-containing protein [Kiritimatiellia bacterium]
MIKRKVKSRSSGFTLIELLVVIAIMGIIVGLTLPAFQSLGRGASMRSAVSQFRAAVSLARQHAIVNRTTTYLVLPHENSALYGSNADLAGMAFRAYNIWSEKDQTYLRSWQFLPKGVVFVNDIVGHYGINRGNNNIFTDPFPAGTTQLLPFPESNSPGPRRAIRAIGFRSDGSCLISGDPEIFLAEGTILIDPGNGAILSYDYRKPLESTALFGVQIRDKTGRTRVFDYRSP